jgi:hypothetical protein
LVSSPTKTISEEPGRSVAEIKAEANRPHKPDSGENSNIVVMVLG